jgi:hypothetical protein
LAAPALVEVLRVEALRVEVLRDEVLRGDDFVAADFAAGFFAAADFLAAGYLAAGFFTAGSAAEFWAGVSASTPGTMGSRSSVSGSTRQPYQRRLSHSPQDSVPLRIDYKTGENEPNDGPLGTVGEARRGVDSTAVR